MYNLLLEAGQAGQQPSMLAMFLPLILMFALMYFLAIRPQKKRDEALRKQIDAMQVGDRVVTIGGITGRIFNIQGDEVTVSTSVQNTLMTFKKSAIANVISDRQPEASAEADNKEKKAEKKK
ncbi:MAG: preprotein translocase subunit YajC [Eubacteriales bacterium]|nr:preprotein translocase subunit YajC [Eubacteriales bacterium]